MLAIMVALAIGVAAWIGAMLALFGLPPRFGQDPYGYLDLARWLFEGRGFAFRYPWLGDGYATPSFPPGWPLVLSALLRVTGLGDDEAAQTGRLLALGCAALSPALLYGLVRRLLIADDRDSVDASRAHRIALRSALLLAASPMLHRSGLLLMSDAPTLLVLLGGFWAALALGRWPALSTGLLCGLLSGGAVLMRYAAAPAAAMGVGLVALYLRRRRDPIRALIGLASMLVGLGFAGVIAWGLLPPEAVLAHPIGQDWSPLHALRTEFRGPDGLSEWGGPLALIYALDLLRPGIGALGLGPLAIAGALWQRPRAGVAPPSPELRRLALLMWGALFALVLGLPEHNPRFWLLALPFAAVLGALALDQVRALPLRRARALSRGLLALVVIAGLAGGVRESRRLEIQVGREEAQIGTLRKIARDAQHLGGRLRIFTIGLSLPLHAHAPEIEPWDAWQASDTDWDAALARPGACVLVLPERAPEQWGGTDAGLRLLRASWRSDGEAVPVEGMTLFAVDCNPAKTGS